MKTKTDKADAQMIAQYGLERQLEWWQPTMSQMKNLRDLCRERASLKKDLVRCKCQVVSYAGLRKLLVLIFVLWKKNEAYNAEYQWDAR